LKSTLLGAPKREKTQEEILEEERAKIREQVEQAKESLSEKLRKPAEKVGEVKEKLVEAIEDAKDKANETLEKAKRGDTGKGGAELIDKGLKHLRPAAEPEQKQQNVVQEKAAQVQSAVADQVQQVKIAVRGKKDHEKTQTELLEEESERLQRKVQYTREAVRDRLDRFALKASNLENRVAAKAQKVKETVDEKLEEARHGDTGKGGQELLQKGLEKPTPSSQPSEQHSQTLQAMPFTRSRWLLMAKMTSTRAKMSFSRSKLQS